MQHSVKQLEYGETHNRQQNGSEENLYILWITNLVARVLDDIFQTQIWLPMYIF